MFVDYDDIRVKLLYYTPINIAVEAALVCTDNDDRLDEYKKDSQTFLLKLLEHGHESIFEHINYTFKVQNISRALLQELARHRHISLSVMSTRYTLKKVVDKQQLIFKLPHFSSRNDEETVMYNKLINTLVELENVVADAVDTGIKNDVLKYFIPEALVTKLVLTVNCRELRHIFQLRLSNRALEEFRCLCMSLYNALPDDHKFLYNDIVLV
ncbi:MAG TPA: FAD-dependent thymidylate synthase [Bacilli bacterium]|nr:FAD-dependent thymidylate synthase [Bacilli bacterium]